MTLQARWQRAADDLAPAIQALSEAEETLEFASDRRDGLDKARQVLSPEALKALDLSDAPAPTQKRRRVPLQDQDPWG